MFNLLTKALSVVAGIAGVAMMAWGLFSSEKRKDKWGVGVAALVAAGALWFWSDSREIAKIEKELDQEEAEEKERAAGEKSEGT
jgi:hypothetical protein